MKKYNFIYKTTNTKNNKFYIGQHRTNNLNDNYYGSGKYIKNAKKKYGKEFNIIFKREILEYCKEKYLNLKEESYIKIYKNSILCMNLKDGSSQSSHCEKTKKLMSESHKGNKHSKDTKTKISEKNKGHLVSKETRSKISISRKGKYEGKNNPNYGKKHSVETKQKISNTNKGHKYHLGNKFRLGKKHSDITKRKIGNKHKNKIVSDITKLKMSLSKKGKLTGKNNPNYGNTGQKNSLYGTKWINKDNVNQRVKIDKLKDYVDNGWKLGREL